MSLIYITNINIISSKFINNKSKYGSYTGMFISRAKYLKITKLEYTDNIANYISGIILNIIENWPPPPPHLII